jgi:division protein CdvB (Snf7/Vps24/ESCRT-III family)
MDDDHDIKISALCQSVTRDGKTVQIEIFEDGENGWLLEVVDEYGNSTVWDDPFDTEQEALDEAMNTLDEEGIDALIGPESGEWK